VGVLIVEAIIASFLMLFAFIAASQLFDASLRWESSSINDRLAALVAERRMEELRGWVDSQCTATGFQDLNWASVEVVDDSYSESPGFLITVRTGLPRNTQPRAGTGRAAVPDGLHSPSSQIFAEAPAAANRQRNAIWQSYPYTRHMDESARLVEVTVSYGTGGEREFQVVSLLGDPIAPPLPPDIDFVPSPVVISGPGSLGVGSPANYTVEVRLPGGQPIQDVTTLWSIDPESSGSARIRPLDAGGSEIELIRDPNATPGSTIILTAKVRYRGKEIVGYLNPINLP
jgi:hypothetical protein